MVSEIPKSESVDSSQYEPAPRTDSATTNENQESKSPISPEGSPVIVEKESEIVLDEEGEGKNLEYAQYKKEFKQSKQAYLAALEQDYADRSVINKVLGHGRKDLSPAVQSAYDLFMSANQAFYNYAKTSGHYERVTDRLNRKYITNEQVSINPLVADRHILGPAEERLERQQVRSPEGVLQVKKLLRRRYDRILKSL
ncbi:hypothetical protein GW766_03260 [Candidatus Parcubacteria bacterium]|nr:hypothetical protein [Candidatus Parcubacteria bacterium]